MHGESLCPVPSVRPVTGGVSGCVPPPAAARPQPDACQRRTRLGPCCFLCVKINFQPDGKTLICTSKRFAAICQHEQKPELALVIFPGPCLRQIPAPPSSCWPPLDSLGVRGPLLPFSPALRPPRKPPRAVDSSRLGNEGDVMIPWQKFRWRRPRFAHRSLGAAGAHPPSASQNLLGLVLCFQLRTPRRGTRLPLQPWGSAGGVTSHRPYPPMPTRDGTGVSGRAAIGATPAPVPRLRALNHSRRSPGSIQAMLRLR